MNVLERLLNLGEGAFVFAILTVLVLAYAFGIEYKRRPIPGYCKKCRYDLTSNVSGKCPECGTTVISDARPRLTRALLERLLVESVLAACATLSFISTYSFCVVLQTRPATPTSLHGIYLPSSAMIVFLIGLIHVLRKRREQRPWGIVPLWCFGSGISLAALNLMLGTLWR